MCVHWKLDECNNIESSENDSVHHVPLSGLHEQLHELFSKLSPEDQKLLQVLDSSTLSNILDEPVTTNNES